MNVGIVGLGLIGGSMAKAYKAAGHTVYAKDTDESILEFAKLSDAVDHTLDDGSIGQCELLLIAVYPQAAIEFLEGHCENIRPETMVIDCCGTKKNVCKAGFEAARRCGFTFAGGHPMAGTEQSGFKHSKANMFKGAVMIIVPPVYDDMNLFEKIKDILAPAGFKNITITTAEKHDEMIAFTSQMAHLVSNAFIKSPTVRGHKGYSAGSYKDLTRVAWLNEYMWTDLFLENKDNLINELDIFINSLAEYKRALEENDHGKMVALLREGRLLKEEIDRR